MPLLKTADLPVSSIAPGVLRKALCNGDRGSVSVTINEVTLEPGSATIPHYHPTEEAMYILAGELEANVGGEKFTVKAGEVVLAPPTVVHGFANRSSSPARLLGIHPTNNVITTEVK